MAKIGFWSMLGNTMALGALAASGCDFVGLDAQHGVIGVGELAAGLQVLGARGVSSIVRVISAEDPLFAHALDFGAGAILVPMVRGPADLEEAVRRSRLQPAGTRSVVGERFNGSGVGLWDEGPQGAEGTGTGIWGMLETREAAEKLDEIARVEGLGGLFVGPSDLALAYGMQPGSKEAESLSASIGRRVVDLAKRWQWLPGIFVGEGTHVGEAAAAGFERVVVGSDLGWLERLAEEQVRAARKGDVRCTSGGAGSPGGPQELSSATQCV